MLGEARGAFTGSFLPAGLSGQGGQGFVEVSQNLGAKSIIGTR